MGYGRAVLWGAAAGILVVVIGVVGLVVLGPSMRSPMTVPGDRVLLIVASRSGTDGSQVAQLIGVADLAGGRLSIGLIDPMTTVTVAGTTANRLSDAYAFGGGAGVAKAYAGVTGGEPLPVIAVSQQGLEALVDGLGGVTVTVPAATSVFDGKRLFTLAGGPQRLRGGDVVALLSSTDFLKTTQERATLRSAVVSGLAEGVAASSADLSTMSARGVTSTLKPSDLQALGKRLRAALPGASITPLVR